MAIYVWHRRESGLVTQPVYKLVITEHQTQEYVLFKDSFTSPPPLEMLWVGEGGFLGKRAPVYCMCPFYRCYYFQECIKPFPTPTLTLLPQAPGLAIGQTFVSYHCVSFTRWGIWGLIVAQGPTARKTNFY